MYINIKYKYKFVKDYFKKNGCVLLEEKYKNCKTEMSYICSCGNKAKIMFDSFKQGRRCNKCGAQRTAAKLRHSYQFVYEIFEKADCRLISKTYTNSAIRNIFNQLGGKKESHIENLLGYSSIELYEHLTNHPNWEKVKNSKWNIDHIFPIKAFIEYKITDIALINCLDNLQPLLAEDNFKKSDKYNKAEFEAWLRKHNVQS